MSGVPDEDNEDSDDERGGVEEVSHGLVAGVVTA